MPGPSSSREFPTAEIGKTELRDVEGKPVSAAQAREIVLSRYQVPEYVRRRNNKRAR